jgi:anti-sigma-K factor RskA
VKLRDPERADAIAAEYVLGTLRGRARSRFERMARAERRLADAVSAWEERLLPLAESLPPVAPPARVWTAILGRIHGTAVNPERVASRLAAVGWWRGLALTSLAVAVALAVALLKPAPESPQGALVVVLAGQDAKPALIASTDRASRYLTVAAIAPIALASDRALELWMLPGQGNPRSLGLVSAVAPGGIARVALPATAEQALRDIPALAVSLEPAGGSPTGLPTGPVLYSGPVRRLY